MSIREPLILITIFHHLHSILDKISFLRAFPMLKRKGYIKSIQEISNLPTKAFGHRLNCLIKNVDCDPNIKLDRYLWEKSSNNKFRRLVETKKYDIRAFEGCEFLELYRDKHNTNVFFTYSFWNTEADLENYRNSNLFKSVWAKTKPLFNAKPEAWSVDKLATLD